VVDPFDALAKLAIETLLAHESFGDIAVSNYYLLEI
jgi:hypothetical protein